MSKYCIQYKVFHILVFFREGKTQNQDYNTYNSVFQNEKKVTLLEEAPPPPQKKKTLFFLPLFYPITNHTQNSIHHRSQRSLTTQSGNFSLQTLSFDSKLSFYRSFIVKQMEDSLIFLRTKQVDNTNTNASMMCHTMYFVH